MGRYASVVNPFSQAGASETSEPAPPRFEPARPLNVKLPEGDRWVKPSDFAGPNAVMGRIRARFGAGVAAWREGLVEALSRLD